MWRFCGTLCRTCLVQLSECCSEVADGAEELRAHVAFHAALRCSYQAFVSGLETKVCVNPRPRRGICLFGPRNLRWAVGAAPARAGPVPQY